MSLVRPWGWMLCCYCSFLTVLGKEMLSAQVPASSSTPPQSDVALAHVLNQLRTAHHLGESQCPSSLVSTLKILLASPYSKISNGGSTVVTDNMGVAEGAPNSSGSAQHSDAVTVGNILLELLRPVQECAADIGELKPLKVATELLCNLSSTSISSIIKFIGQELTLYGSAAGTSYGNIGVATALFGAGGKRNPTLLAAQSLFLYTKAFQCTDAHIREVCALIEKLLEEVQRIATHSGGSNLTFKIFHFAEMTSNLSSVCFFVVWSLIHMISAWNSVLHGAAPALHSNQLVQSTVIPNFLVEWLDKQRRSHAAESSLHGSMAGAGLGRSVSIGPGSQQGALAQYTAQHAQHSSVGKIPMAYLAMIRLAVGAHLSARRDAQDKERAADLIVDSFLGERADMRNATNSQINSELKGKVCKRILQLFPREEAMSVPMACVAESPFLLLSHIFDEALPALHHVADLDLKSYQLFLELAREEELTALQQHHAAAPGLGGNQFYRGGLLGPQQQQQQLGTGMNTTVVPSATQFTSALTHLLQLVSYLVSRVPKRHLTPREADNGTTAVVFFVFQNVVMHLRSVFELQKQDTVWDPFAHRIVASFVEVLTALAVCGDSATNERIRLFLCESQTDCTDVQWGALIAQVRECLQPASFSSEVHRSALQSRNGSGFSRISSKQSSPEFAKKHQAVFVQRVIELLRRVLCADSSLMDQLTIEVPLALMRGASISQPILGSLLQLVGALVRSPGDAEKLWSMLESENLLASPTGAGERHHGNVANQRGTSSASGEENVAVHSFLGHALHETHFGAYPITIGVLHLLYGIANHFVPSPQQLTRLTNVVRFVADEILSGVRRRVFLDPREMYVVMSLACHFLTKVSAIVATASSDASSGPRQQLSKIPISVIMASARAPADVLGDLLDLLQTASVRALTDVLTVSEVATLRGALSLLLVGVTEQATTRDVTNAASNGTSLPIGCSFPMEARTYDNVEFTISLLRLISSCGDATISQLCVSLLAKLPNTSTSNAVRHLAMRPDLSRQFIEAFTQHLEPTSCNLVSVDSIPGLEFIDDVFRAKARIPGFDMNTKHALLDLLIKNAPAPHPSLLSWAVGCPLFRIVSTTQSNGTANSNVRGEGGEHQCLEAIVAAANDADLVNERSSVATKYVKLIYLLKLNLTIGSCQGVRDVLRARGADKYLFSVLECGSVASGAHPDVLARHGLCLKTLALDVFRFTRDGAPHADQRTAAQILEKLLCTTRGINPMQFSVMGGGGGAASASFLASTTRSLYPTRFDRTLEDVSSLSSIEGGSAPNDAMMVVPFRTWIATVLESLPIFPSLSVPPGGLNYYVKALSDGTPQYSIEELYRSFAALSRNGSGSGGEATSTSGDAHLLQQLRPYLLANECLLSYSSAVMFVEGWCTLVEVASSIQLNGGNKPPASAAASSSTAVGGKPSPLEPILGQLTCEELLLYLQTIMKAITVSSNFTIAAQEQMIPSLSRSALTITAKLQLASKDLHPPAWSRGAVQTSIAATLDVLCTLGPKSVALRNDLYSALVMFLMLPELPLDPMVLYRAHIQLFSLLLNDIGDSTTPTLQLSALNLLRSLLTNSGQLRDVFCLGSNGSGCAPTLGQFSASALACLDDLVVDTIVHGGRDTSLVAYIVQAVFDVMTMLAVEHADALYRSNAFALCNRMNLWTIGTRMTLDYVSISNPAATRGNPLSGATTTQLNLQAASTQLLLQRVLVGALRWYNAALRALCKFDDAVLSMSEFVNINQLLLQLALSPAKGSLLAAPGPSVVLANSTQTTTSLSLLYEASELLLNFSSTSLVDQCAKLIVTFAVPSLLCELTRRDVRTPTTMTLEHLANTLSISRSTRNIALFVANVELRSVAAAARSAISPSSNSVDSNSSATLKSYVSLLQNITSALQETVAIQNPGVWESGLLFVRLLEGIRISFVEALQAISLIVQYLAFRESRTVLLSDTSNNSTTATTMNPFSNVPLTSSPSSFLAIIHEASTKATSVVQSARAASNKNALSGGRINVDAQKAEGLITALTTVGDMMATFRNPVAASDAPVDPNQSLLAGTRAGGVAVAVDDIRYHRCEVILSNLRALASATF